MTHAAATRSPDTSLAGAECLTRAASCCDTGLGPDLGRLAVSWGGPPGSQRAGIMRMRTPSRTRQQEPARRGRSWPSRDVRSSRVAESGALRANTTINYPEGLALGAWGRCAPDEAIACRLRMFQVCSPP